MSLPLYRYSKWDGTQEPFSPDADQVMEALSDDLLAHGNPWEALRRLLQRGLRSDHARMEGLRDLLERVRQQRQQRLQRHNLDTLVDDLKQRLQDIIATERRDMEHRLQEAERRAQATPAQQKLRDTVQRMVERNRSHLDQLPPDMAGQVKGLQAYDFMSPTARQMFQELLDMLQKQMLDSHVKDLSQRLRSITPEQMKGLRQMAQELNELLREHMRGVEPDFQGFMQRWGHMFGPNPPQDLDELIDRIQRQMAQMQSLLDSMSPGQRQELEELLQSALDSETMRDLAQLAATLDLLHPIDQMGREYPFSGDDPLTLNDAMRLMEQLQELDDLERQLAEAERGDLSAVDEEKLARQAGEEARRALQQLQAIQRQLEEAGYLRRDGDRLELTPKAIRKIGQKALRDLYDQLRRDRIGSHALRVKGSGGEDAGETKRYESGDDFDLDLQQTIHNAVRRSRATVPVALEPGDFEVRRHEMLTRTATVVLLDQSRSMGFSGNFQAAKKVAVALSSLIHTQFPRDSLYLAGFSDYAVELTIADLPRTSWNHWVSGTNMHHALALARKLLAKHKGGTRQVILITDGEPTTHLEKGTAIFTYPPSRKTIVETLNEVRQCTREGITINTFMLESSAYLMDFVAKLTRINKGRAFYTTPQDLGRYVLVDYLKHRRRRVA